MLQQRDKTKLCSKNMLIYIYIKKIIEERFKYDKNDSTQEPNGSGYEINYQNKNSGGMSTDLLQATIRNHLPSSRMS